MKTVRIRYWEQDTIETGHWETTGSIREKDLKHWQWVIENKSGQIIDTEEKL